MEGNAYRYRCLASWLLIFLTAIQPFHPAIAASTAHVQSPVVDIDTPNPFGISHNYYNDFNVTSDGVVLNNATEAGQSVLAGQLAANPNLNGKSAKLIINEITSSDMTTLAGKLEVFGQKADVIIANPNGLTCNGCGFINANGITLTTGTLILSSQGELDRINVMGVTITIGDKGFNSQLQDYAQLISHSLVLEGGV